MIHFRKLVEADLEMVLRWRTTSEITRYMTTDVEFDLGAQRIWYQTVVQIHIPTRHWIICHDNKPIGVFSLATYDNQNDLTSVGYYLGDLNAWSLGAIIPPYFYNYMFFQRAPNLKAIIGEAFCLNSKVIQMHLMHGWTVTKTLRNHVVKHGQEYDVKLLELTRENWIGQQGRFGAYRTEFEE